jgi:hypothetical protein
MNKIRKFQYVGYKINISWDNLEYYLKRYIEKYNLDPDPDFQRGHVWTETQQQKYVEFKLRGGSGSNEILFNCPGWLISYDGQMVLVDGKQRLEAVRRFMKNELEVFQEENEGVGVKMIDLFYTPSFFTELNFVFAINNLEERKDILQWYLDLNDGGVVHTKEELEKVKTMIKNSTSN